MQVALADLTEAPLFLDDSAGVNLMVVHAKLRRMQCQHGLSLVVVDYLQLMGSRGRNENRNQEISGISAGSEADGQGPGMCLVVVLSQLSRDVREVTGDHRPAVE